MSIDQKYISHAWKSDSYNHYLNGDLRLISVFGFSFSKSSVLYVIARISYMHTSDGMLFFLYSARICGHISLDSFAPYLHFSKLIFTVFSSRNKAKYNETGGEN